MTKLDVKASQALFIDDQANNVMGAQAMGIHAVQYQCQIQVITAVRDWHN